MINKKYISIFCFAETKVRSIDFMTKGITLHSQERSTREKRGGVLAIGYISNNNIDLQRIETNHSDIMVLEGKIYNKNVKIILTYMDCTKAKRGDAYWANRHIQKRIEELMIVEPETLLICMGDFNARLSCLEPKIG